MDGISKVGTLLDFGSDCRMVSVVLVKRFPKRSFFDKRTGSFSEDGNHGAGTFVSETLLQFIQPRVSGASLL